MRSSSAATPSKAVKTMIVILRLSPKVLNEFPQEGTSVTQTSLLPADSKSEVDNSSTSTPLNTQTNDNTADIKKTTVTALKAGIKRPSSAHEGPNRPGPKKKARITDGASDRPTPTAKRVGGAAATGGAKGPRGGTGAINAGLRALDRSGKPCRRWNRKGFELKSFTGVQWSLGSWTAPKPDTDFAGDVKSDASSSTGVAVPLADASRASDSSNSGNIMGQANGLASSPVRAA